MSEDNKKKYDYSHLSREELEQKLEISQIALEHISGITAKTLDGVSVAERYFLTRELNAHQISALNALSEVAKEPAPETPKIGDKSYLCQYWPNPT